MPSEKCIRVLAGPFAAVHAKRNLCQLVQSPLLCTKLRWFDGLVHCCAFTQLLKFEVLNFSCVLMHFCHPKHLVWSHDRASQQCCNDIMSSAAFSESISCSLSLSLTLIYSLRLYALCWQPARLRNQIEYSYQWFVGSQAGWVLAALHCLFTLILPAYSLWDDVDGCWRHCGDANWGQQWW